MVDLILASTSPYRRDLLGRLGMPFRVISPDVDESAETAADAGALANRLALLKARAVAGRYPQAVVIGSDQVAVCNGQALGKPGTFERAVSQLESCSGREVVFHTAAAVVHGEREVSRVVPTHVRMKKLTAGQIRAYVETDQPLDCAGAMKCERLGIALTNTITSDDPTALIGLPLIAVAEMLESLGVTILDSRRQRAPSR